MPVLTRRSNDDRSDSWHVYYGDVNVGWIGKRAGVPVDLEQWRWSCGFYPGGHPREHVTGTAPDFITARREFEIA